ncbi:MAG: CarD family transcriptional regulator [Alphaproteobacteria bacterium]|nr:CarD family transcriptional regulator [Alphaproteobacteria bacterium]
MAEKKQKAKTAAKKVTGKAAAAKRSATKSSARKATTTRSAGSAKSAARSGSAAAKKAAATKATKAKATKASSAAKTSTKKAVSKPAAKAKAKAVAKKPATKTAAKTAAAKTAAKAKSTATKKASVKAAMKAAAAKIAAASAAKAAKTKAKAKPVAAPKATAKSAVKPAVATKAAAKAAAPALDKKKKPANQKHGFKINEFVVYPAHGVGKIIGIEEQEIAGMALELFVINFEKEKLTLRVPTGKLESVGMRKLAGDELVKKAMETLKGRARVKRTMWSRRAQEYIAKINSGDLISIAEVVRDLYRSEAQPEQSYSERQLYEDALDRMARELAAVEKLDERGAVQRITEVLSKSARGRRLAEESETAAASAA